MKNSIGDISGDLQKIAQHMHDSEMSWIHQNLTETEKKADQIRQTQAKPGALGLPELLDKRRIQYGIPDGVFKEHCLFDRIFVYQIRLRQSKMAGDDSRIALSSIGLRRELESAPYGIIVSAGLPALDKLRSNGVDLGHIVGFIREAPWRKPVEVIDGVEFSILLLRVGDLTGSVDLASMVRYGTCKLHVREIENSDGITTKEHCWIGKDGKILNPSMPFMPADV